MNGVWGTFLSSSPASSAGGTGLASSAGDFPTVDLVLVVLALVFLLIGIFVGVKPVGWKIVSDILSGFLGLYVGKFVVDALTPTGFYSWLLNLFRNNVSATRWVLYILAVLVLGFAFGLVLDLLGKLLIKLTEPHHVARAIFGAVVGIVDLMEIAYTFVFLFGIVYNALGAKNPAVMVDIHNALNSSFLLSRLTQTVDFLYDYLSFKG
jgi:hypothetical protein